MVRTQHTTAEKKIIEYLQSKPKEMKSELIIKTEISKLDVLDFKLWVKPRSWASNRIIRVAGWLTIHDWNGRNRTPLLHYLLIEWMSLLIVFLLMCGALVMDVDIQ